MQAFLSLRQRNFRLYWCGQAISLIGTWMQIIGQTWLVLSLTHSAWQIGLVGALQSFPILIFSIFGGVVADRWPKKRILLVTQVGSAIQACVFWVLIATGVVQLWEVYVLACMLGLLNSMGRPTSRAFVVEMVGREDLPNAAGLYSALSTLAGILGPGLGGIIIAARGVTLLFLLNALSFLPILLSLVLIRSYELHISAREQKVQNMWQSLHEGLEYIRHQPVVLLILLVVGLVLFFGSNFTVLLPLFATDILHVGARGYGFLSAATSVGALLAALWVA